MDKKTTKQNFTEQTTQHPNESKNQKEKRIVKENKDKPLKK